MDKMKIFDYVCRKLCRICIWYTKYKKQSTKYKIQNTNYKIQLWWWCTLSTPHTNKLNETPDFKQINGCLWRQLCYKQKTIGCLWRQMCYFKAKPLSIFKIWSSKKQLLTVESWCGIEPQSLANENLTIRLSRFTRTEAI